MKKVFAIWKIKTGVLLMFFALLTFCLVAQAADNYQGDIGLDSRSGLDSIEKISKHNDAIMEKLDVRAPTGVVAEPQPIMIDEQSVTQPEKRDPFAVTGRLLQAASNDQSALFSPLPQAGKIPPMHLRGLIRDGDGGLAALLEINKAIHIVRDGDTVGLHDLGINTVIRIRKINRLNIIVETGTLGQMIIVR